MSAYSQIHEFLGADWNSFQKSFHKGLSTEIPTLKRVNDYLLERSGKQLRPMLTLLTARALSGECNENSVRCAVAVEMMHTASLLHDDVADDSAVRRGSPTIRSLYSPTVAVLVGDFWLSRAMENVIGHCPENVIISFSNALRMLAEGEMIQMEKARTLDATEEDYMRIIYCKTAALFETAIVSSAYCVNASERETAAVKAYAKHVGSAFQIMDDIFDYSPQLNTGKPTGQDILEKKITLPLFGFIRNAPKKDVRDIFSRIRKIGEDSEADARLGADAVRLVNEYGGIEYAHGRMLSEIEAAEASLACIGDSPAKSFLVELAGHMSVRTS